MKIVYLKDYKEYIPALANWSYKTWGGYNPQPSIKNQIEKFKQHCNTDKLPLTLIALDNNDKPIGMCSLRETDSIRSDLAPWLGSLYVTPSQRNKYVATKLTQAIKDIARHMGYEKLYLFTFDKNLNTFYINQGWVLIGEDVLNDCPVSIMGIEL